MTHSTLTWFSGSIEPKEDEQFLVSFMGLKENFVVYNKLCRYDKANKIFTDGIRDIALKQVYYWAYVPMELDFRREGKQSQVPEEK